MASVPPSAAAPAVPAVVEPSPGTTDAVPVIAEQAEPAARSTVQARPPAPATSTPTTSKPTTAKPTPRTVQAAPTPEPVAAEPASNCHPSYSPCLPDGPDLDCGDINGQVT
jgi:hypothetical protein